MEVERQLLELDLEPDDGAMLNMYLQEDQLVSDEALLEFGTEEKKNKEQRMEIVSEEKAADEISTRGSSEPNNKNAVPTTPRLSVLDVRDSLNYIFRLGPVYETILEISDASRVAKEVSCNVELYGMKGLEAECKQLALMLQALKSSYADDFRTACLWELYMRTGSFLVD